MYIQIATNIKQNYFISRIMSELSLFSLKCSVFDPYCSDIPKSSYPILWRTTGINYDDSDLIKAINLEINTINPANSLLLLRDKLKTFYELNTKLPLACAIPLKQFLDETKDINLKIYFQENPTMVKTIRGNQGHGVYFIEDEAWWHRFTLDCNNKQDFNYFVQPRYFGKEYRMFLLKGESPIILERTSTSLKANFHQDGSAKLVNTNEFDYLANLIHTHLDFNYLALDFIVSNEELFIIDINGVCGIEQLEKVSGQNIARKILNQII